MKCVACKKDFKKEELKSFTNKSKKYCPKCYQEEAYRKAIVENCYNLYHHKQEYKTICLQLNVLRKSGMSYYDVFYTLKYTQEILRLKFNEGLFLGLGRYYYSAMKFYKEVSELKQKKVFENIEPKVIKTSKVFKPIKIINPTDMSKI